MGRGPLSSRTSTGASQDDSPGRWMPTRAGRWPGASITIIHEPEAMPSTTQRPSGPLVTRGPGSPESRSIVTVAPGSEAPSSPVTRPSIRARPVQSRAPAAAARPSRVARQTHGDGRIEGEYTGAPGPPRGRATPIIQGGGTLHVRLGHLPGPAARPAHAGGRAPRDARERSGALRGLRAPLPDPPGPGGHLPGPLQRGGRAAGALGLRVGAPAGPGGEEAVLPRAARLPGAVVRDARLRLHCALLPELDHLPGAAGRRGRAPRPSRSAPEEVVRVAAERGARIVTSTYNEPLITSEWAVDVFRHARERGAGVLLRLERERDRGGARVPAALGVPLQGRPQGLPGPPLPGPGRDPRARALDDPGPSRQGLLGGGGDPGRARLQRLGGGAHRHRPIPRWACRRASRGT